METSTNEIRKIVPRPLKNAPFCPISASVSNFNPQNTQCIPLVKIFGFLEPGQNWTFFKGLVPCVLVVFCLIVFSGCSDSLEEVGSYAPVDNSLFSGAYVITFEDDTYEYFYALDGDVYDNSFAGGGVGEITGDYQSLSDGSYSFNINTTGPDVRLTGQTTAVSEKITQLPDGTIVVIRRLTDGTIVYSNGQETKSGTVQEGLYSESQESWKGTLTEQGSARIYEVVFQVDSNNFGFIRQFSTRTLPFDFGRMVLTPENAVAYLKVDKNSENGDSVPYDEFRFYGTISDNILTGTYDTIDKEITGTVEFERIEEVVKSSYKEECESMTATINTSMGSIVVDLYVNERPETVWNFVNLAEGRHDAIDVNGPFYDGLIFHRVIAEFIIQSGSPYGDGTGGPGYTFDDEFDPPLDHGHDYEGVLSMANNGPDTNGSGFFITLAETPDWDEDGEPDLDSRHTIFGKVISGIEVVREIGVVETDDSDKPEDDIVINSITVDHSQCDSGS